MRASNLFSSPFLAKTCFCFLLLPLSLSKANATEIDLLVLYTPGLAAAYDGDASTRINHMIAVTNSIYSDSEMDLSVRAVASVEVDYPDTGASLDALYAATDGSHAAFSNVNALREQYGADMVTVFRPYDYSHGNCGIAWIGGYGTNGNMSGQWKNYMVSHVSATTCPDYVTANELGDNRGVSHCRGKDGAGGRVPHRALKNKGRWGIP